MPDPELSAAVERLRAQLTTANSELRAHMASWEYAYAMGSSREGAGEHPKHAETHATTARLTDRCRDLRARLAEYEI